MQVGLHRYAGIVKQEYCQYQYNPHFTPSLLCLLLLLVLPYQFLIGSHLLIQLFEVLPTDGAETVHNRRPIASWLSLNFFVDWF